MNVLLSIKPNFVDKIISGEKKYEFRKTEFKNHDVLNRIYIYSTSPIKRIVGSFKIGRIVSGTPANIWEECQDFAGISKADFFDYFQNNNKAVAIAIEDLEIFESPIDPFEQFQNFRAPQSFYYIKENSWKFPSNEKNVKLSRFS
jgi:predicted transcriptional regulator